MTNKVKKFIVFGIYLIFQKFTKLCVHLLANVEYSLIFLHITYFNLKVQLLMSVCFELYINHGYIFMGFFE